MSFQTRFSDLLARHHLTALQLSKEIGVPKSIIYEWKSGVREPGMTHLQKLSDYFGVGILYLVGQEEKELDESEEELMVLLRRAKQISPEEHDELVENFRQNLSLYLRAKTAEKSDDT